MKQLSPALVILGFLLFPFFSSAQGPALTGSVRDAESGAALRGASIALRSIKDSTFSRSVLTDSSGQFRFTDLPRDSFRISFSSIGYETLTRSIRVDSVDVTMPEITLPRSSQELTGVTVTARTPPATQKGDTVQFNASQFKVNPDATAEDLARKIPGITIENGQVKANGENVQKVTIDGRELFGDDATAALRNLPAEVIDKIQVFDRLSDQAQLTGFDDGNAQRGINIVTRANMRNGQFGRVFAGYGTDNRYTAGGNTTFFKENRRISLVGNFNNINQQNFAQQDLLGVTSTGAGNRGNNRGGGGNRGPQGAQGGNRGGGQGGFGNNGNFLVGQQPGINRTNAFGINYSDQWGKKMTVTGSYFFNDTRNNTEEQVSTQFFNDRRTNAYDTTTAQSDNTNHRINLRLEYKIDSNNQLIITPNVSFQNNETVRRVARTSIYDKTNPGGLSTFYSLNNTRSDRSGLNGNGNILYRHSFAKRGRTFSVNFTSGYNQRNGESYVNTQQHTEYLLGAMVDTSSQRFTDQSNNGLNLSTNFIYTEPLGKEGQLQLNYNPGVSKSESEQIAYGKNTSSEKYDVFLDSLSNLFENKTTTQNAGVAYRRGNRDRMLSIGANYQSTHLESDQTFPRALNVDKRYQNILPNAMLRYKLSAKSSVRIFYRANVNQPSVTQLQNVVDPTGAPNYNVGNPDLNQQYMHIVSTQYTFTNTQKGLLLVGNVFLQTAQDYIANASFNIQGADSLVNGQRIFRGEQLTKPVNLDGYRSLRSFLTFAIPAKFIKSNLNLNGGYTYTSQPGFNNYINTQTNSNVFTLGSVISSNISQYVDFTVSYSGNFNQVQSNIGTRDTTTNYYSHQASLQLNLLSKKGFFFQNDLNNQLYSGLTPGFDQNYFLWNMGVGYKFLPQRKGEVKLSVFDLLGQNRSIVRTVTESGIEDTRNVVLQQYFMLTFTYNLRNFGTAATRQAARQEQRTRNRE
jgi:hypothetical protein